MSLMNRFINPPRCFTFCLLCWIVKLFCFGHDSNDQEQSTNFLANIVTATMSTTTATVSKLLAASYIIHTASSQLCNIDGSSSTYWESLELGQNIRRIQASGCPNHDVTCVGKPGKCTFRGESLNVTTSTHQNKNIEIPAVPCISDLATPYDITCDGGGIGILLNGASVFSQTAGNGGEGECDDAVVAEFTAFSMCGGHATPYGEWHHHVLPSCLLAQLGDHGESNPNGQHSPQIGWSFDGFPIYGPHGVDGQKMYKCTDSRANPNDCLDECNGQGVYPGALAGGHIIDGYVYHYHVTGPVADLSGDIKTSTLDPAPDASHSPYTIGCWRGIYPKKTAVFKKVECAYPGVTNDFIPRVKQGVSDWIYPNVVPPTTYSPTEDPTPAPTNIPSNSPTPSPTIPDCVSVSRRYKKNFGGVTSGNANSVLTVNGYRDETKVAFANGYSNCIDPSNVNGMDYVYKVDYKSRQKKLTVNMYVCCGENRLFTVQQVDDYARQNYFQEGGAFHVFWQDEDEPLGAKEIVVIVIICLLVIGGIGGVVYWYKRKRRGQASFDGSPTNESKTTDNAQEEKDGKLSIEMPTKVKDDETKMSPLADKKMQIDPYKEVDGDGANITVR